MRWCLWPCGWMVVAFLLGVTAESSPSTAGRTSLMCWRWLCFSGAGSGASKVLQGVLQAITLPSSAAPTPTPACCRAPLSLAARQDEGCDELWHGACCPCPCWACSALDLLCPLLGLLCCAVLHIGYTILTQRLGDAGCIAACSPARSACCPPAGTNDTRPSHYAAKLGRASAAGSPLPHSLPGLLHSPAVHCCATHQLSPALPCPSLHTFTIPFGSGTEPASTQDTPRDSHCRCCAPPTMPMIPWIPSTRRRELLWASA